MGRRCRKFRFTNGLNGTDRFYYPYRFTQPELNGSRYLDISPEITGSGSFFSNTDPEGCYTGFPENMYEVPTQDADDL